MKMHRVSLKAMKAIGRGTLLAGLLVAATLGSNPAAAANGGPAARVDRQIDLMEKVIDQILLESPNLLVYGHDVTHGLYLAEFGALFSFEASLTGDGMGRLIDLSFLKGLKIETEDGKVTILRESGDEGDSGDAGDAGDAEDEATTEYLVRLKEGEVAGDELADKINEKKAELERRREKALAHERELFENAKTELNDALIDYGETLTALRDDQWVAIAAFLKNSDFFDERKISRLVLKVKLSDLRAYGADRITQDELRARVIVEES
jgi:hypothetical protein